MLLSILFAILPSAPIDTVRVQPGKPIEFRNDSTLQEGKVLYPNVVMDYLSTQSVSQPQADSAKASYASYASITSGWLMAGQIGGITWATLDGINAKGRSIGDAMLRGALIGGGTTLAFGLLGMLFGLPSLHEGSRHYQEGIKLHNANLKPAAAYVPGKGLVGTLALDW